jgi:ribonuclease BN (tRNA processing enzyme)
MSNGNLNAPDNFTNTRIKEVASNGNFFFYFTFVKRTCMQQPENTNQLNIEISEEVAEGQYANLVIITHSHAEFVIDFVNVMPGMPKSKVKSRIILTPQHAKRLMHAVMENVQRYEEANGEIKELSELAIPLNFGGPAAQA